MDFLRAIINEEKDLILDEDVQQFLEEIESLSDEDLLDESVWDRIEQRVENRDLVFYRYIVGTEKLMLTKKFLELAKAGKSIPAPMVKAYQPAVELIDDIVTAGPAFTRLLLVLQKRAKNSRK